MARIIGVLTDPFEAPIPNTEIRFSAITTEGEVFTGSDASEGTGEDGSYDFPLAEGRYLVEVLNVNEYHESGFVLVDEHTPTPITLTELVRYSRPYTPPEVLEGKPVWDELFEEIVANDEWDRQGESQVRDLDVFANEDKTIHKDDSNYMAKETHTVTSGSSVQSTQSLSYEDEHLQQASTYNIKGEVPLASSQEALGAYKNSDGTTEANHTLTLSDTTGSMVSSTTGSTRSETFTQDSSELSSEVLAEGTSVTSSETASNATVAAETLKYVDANELVDALIKQGIRIEGKPEAFTKLMRNQGKTEYVVQADKTTIQTTDDDGDPLAMATFDGTTGDIYLNGKVHMANEGDFKGEEGWSYITKSTYSNSPEGPWVEVYSEHTYALEQDYRFKASDEENTLEPINEPRVVKLLAKDGADGDKYYIIYEYSEDKASWHSKYSTSDIWRRFKAVVNDVPEDDWSDAERMTGPAGQDGWVPEWDRYYGYGQIDGTVMAIPDLLLAPSDPHSVDHRYWTHDWDTNDAWLYERLIWWKNQEDYLASRHAAGYPDWTLGIEPASIGEWPISPTKVKPEFGVDYFNGYSQAIVNIYKRADSKPDTPSSALTYTFATKVLSGSLEGWTTEVPDGSAPLWASSGSFTAQGATDTIAPNEWAGVALMAKEGSSRFYEYQYSAEANGPWHSDQLDTDYYVRERTVTTTYTGDAPVYGEWASPALFRTDGYTPEKGVDYFDGDFHSTIFKPSKTQPNTPTGGSYNGSIETPPSSWKDDPNYSSDERLWASTAVYQQQPNLTWSHTGWSTPVQWSGEPATNRATVTLYKSSLSKPSVPASNITYTFATGTVSGNLGGWTTTPPDNVAGKLWWTMATAFADGVTATDTISSSEWASVELLVSNGEAGEHGAGSIVVNVPHGTAYPTGTNVVAGDIEEWYVGAVERDSKEYDIITFQRDPNNNPDNETPKSYIRGSSAWESFALSIDGNAMVKGTLAAEALKAGTTLTDTLYISGDATSKEMTLSGEGKYGSNKTHYRMWLGNEDPNAAKFSVDKDGNLKASNGTFHGNITADSRISGAVIEGSTIIGTGIQASYIAADVPLLTLSWYNHEAYGSMDLEYIREVKGTDPYMGYQNIDFNLTGDPVNVPIASYDCLDKVEYWRFVNPIVTPTVEYTTGELDSDSSTRTQRNSCPGTSVSVPCTNSPVVYIMGKTVSMGTRSAGTHYINAGGVQGTLVVTAIDREVSDCDSYSHSDWNYTNYTSSRTVYRKYKNTFTITDIPYVGNQSSFTVRARQSGGSYYTTRCYDSPNNGRAPTEYGKGVGL